MRRKWTVLLALVAWTFTVQGTASPVAFQGQSGSTAQAAAGVSQEDPVRTLVGQLDLEKYKATIKGLTQFGDRRQGTDRNRAANDWIEAQLKSYGCSDIGRIKYEYAPAARAAGANAATGAAAGAAGAGTAAGAAGRGNAAAAAGATGRGAAGAAGGQTAAAQGRGRGSANPVKGNRGPTGVNNDPNKQTDAKLRELDMQPTTPGPREEVYCTKIGSTHPEEMYIVGAHMDGLGYAEGANDNASGTALVMELARIFSAPEVKTDRSIRFVLWNNEETGLEGARAYVAQRAALQGKEDPPNSGKYPEPKWLGMVQHDMMMYDHGMPGPDGKLPAEQRPEADVNIEFAATAKMGAQAQELAWLFKAANDRYATDYPAVVGNRMSNTDSAAFQDLCAAISLREAERLSQVGNGWDPTWHQVIDMFTTFSDKDFRLGLNAAQTTMAAIAQLVGAKTK
jgi:hypothetical protein